MGKNVKNVYESISQTVVTDQLRAVIDRLIYTRQAEQQIRQALNENLEHQARMDAQIALLQTILPAGVFEKTIADINASRAQENTVATKEEQV